MERALSSYINKQKLIYRIFLTCESKNTYACTSREEKLIHIRSDYVFSYGDEFELHECEPGIYLVNICGTNMYTHITILTTKHVK